jgi:aminopeptidase N
MDEGFTNYASQRVMDHLRDQGLIPGSPNPKLFEPMYKGYSNLIQSGFEEPLSTHADHFDSNTAYGISAYNKGAVFLHQLEYVIGKPAFDKGMLDFFNTWKFKHPDDNDFIRIMEHASGLELDWYKDYMVYSVKTVDYAVDTLLDEGPSSSILLRRDGLMPMPVDIVVLLSNGDMLPYTIPLDIMRGAKDEAAYEASPFQVLPDWHWVNPYYLFKIPFAATQIRSVSIDPSLRMADINPDNNHWPMPKS